MSAYQVGVIFGTIFGLCFGIAIAMVILRTACNIVIGDKPSYGNTIITMIVAGIVSFIVQLLLMPSNNSIYSSICNRGNYVWLTAMPSWRRPHWYW